MHDRELADCLPRRPWKPRADSDRRRNGAVRRRARRCSGLRRVRRRPRLAGRSRELRRRTRARGRGATNAEAVRDADLVVLATKAEATLGAARELREAIGSVPTLSCGLRAQLLPLRCPWLRRSILGSGGTACRPSSTAPFSRDSHPLAASRPLGSDEASDEDAFVCGDDPPDAKSLVLAGRRAAHPRAGRSMRARSRARAPPRRA